MHELKDESKVAECFHRDSENRLDSAIPVGHYPVSDGPFPPDFDQAYNTQTRDVGFEILPAYLHYS